jgi:hypothetical protein
MKPLHVHWSSSKPNFGDALSPLICEHLAGRPVVWASVERCDLLAVGSLMQRVKEGFWRHRINIWGSGFIDSAKQHRSRHHYHALRGKFSAAIINGLNPDLPLGDPGLLANLLVEHLPQPAKRYRCILIPHYKDRGHPMLEYLAASMPNTEVVDVFSPPLQILEKIRAAEFVFSSAMHGLIAADSLHVPNAWLKLSDELRGEDFKFRDYYSVFNIEPRPLVPTPDLLKHTKALIETYARPGLNDIQQRLIKSFPYKN